MDWLPPIPVIVAVVACSVAATTDVRGFKVHNLLTLPLLVAGFVYHAVTGGLTQFGATALGALAGFGLLVPFYLLGGMGAGDVKLMAALGAWLGAPAAFALFMLSSLWGGV